MKAVCTSIAWVVAVGMLLAACATAPDPRAKQQAAAAREVGEAYLAKDHLPQAYREFMKAKNLRWFSWAMSSSPAASAGPIFPTAITAN